MISIYSWEGIVMPLSEMTREEAVALARKLAGEYGEMEQLKKEMDENEAIFSQPIPEPAKHAAFKYFLPFLIAAPISGAVLGAASYIALQIGNSRTFNAIFSFLAILVFAGLLIFGGRFAKSKRDEMNNLEIAKHRTQVGKMDDLKRKTNALKSQYRTLQNSVKEYEDVIPASQRTKEQMDKVASFLESGYANDFASALKI